MPIACDPEQTVWISLAVDADKPEPERPQFRCRYLTAAQVRRVGTLINDAIEAGADSKAAKMVAEAVLLGVNGWRNMTDPSGEPLEFDPERLSDILTVTEQFELAGLTVSETRLSEYDRKKSALQSLLDTENSARTTSPASQTDAETTDETDQTSSTTPKAVTDG